MKSDDKQQSNQTNVKDDLDKTNMNTTKEPPTQKDGFRYDYDDSSDL